MNFKDRFLIDIFFLLLCFEKLISSVSFIEMKLMFGTFWPGLKNKSCRMRIMFIKYAKFY